MAGAVKTFRVFISSTFSDFKAERIALQERVFPQLRAYAQKKGCRFQAIDLRWGISREASRAQQTIQICLKEIQRCREISPGVNFIAMLGNRNGWHPLPENIPAGEFESLLNAIKDSGHRNMMHFWYRKDLNAIPPVYVLQPREKKYKTHEYWERKVEIPLLSILQNAAQEIGLPTIERLKYDAPATHQEIEEGVFNVPGSNEHAFCFFRDITDLPQSTAANDYSLTAVTSPTANEKEQKIDILKKRLKKRLPGHCFEYKARWTGNGISQEHIKQFCRDMLNSLKKSMKREISKQEEMTPLQRECSIHQAYKHRHVKCFTGRSNILDEMNHHVRERIPYPLVISGESGSGKTALMAKTVHEIQAENPDLEVVYRFVGITPDSTDIYSLLLSMTCQISSLYKLDIYNLPTDYHELVDLFLKRLEHARSGRPLIIAVDALDQLPGDGVEQNISWIPPRLPNGVFIIVSALPGKYITALKKRTRSAAGKCETGTFPKLEKITPKDANIILEKWLSDSNRTIQPDQKQHVLNQFSKCPLPLYLKLAFEEAVNWFSYSTPDEYRLKDDIPGIINHLINRLSLESNHGRTLVSKVLRYLKSSRAGLTEGEILDILSRDRNLLYHQQKRSPHSPVLNEFPAVLWARLNYELSPYLNRQTSGESSHINLFHRKFREAVGRKFLRQKKKRMETHRMLADYFESCGFENPRTITQLPFHLLEAAANEPFPEDSTKTAPMHDRLYDLITNLNFQNAQLALLNNYQQSISDVERAVKCFVPPKERDTSVYDHRLCRLILRAGELGELAEEDYYIVFQWVENSPFNDSRPIDDAVERLVVLGTNDFFNACLLLLILVAQKQNRLPAEKRLPQFPRKIVRALENKISAHKETFDWLKFLSPEFMSHWTVNILSVFPSLNLVNILSHCSEIEAFIETFTRLLLSSENVPSPSYMLLKELSTKIKDIETKINSLIQALSIALYAQEDIEINDFIGQLESIIFGLRDKALHNQALAEILRTLLKFREITEPFAQDYYSHFLNSIENIKTDISYKSNSMLDVAIDLADAEEFTRSLLIPDKVNDHLARAKIYQEIAVRMIKAGKTNKAKEILKKTEGCLSMVDDYQKTGPILELCIKIAAATAKIGNIDRANKIFLQVQEQVPDVFNFSYETSIIASVAIEMEHMGQSIPAVQLIRNYFEKAQNEAEDPENRNSVLIKDLNRTSANIHIAQAILGFKSISQDAWKLFYSVIDSIEEMSYDQYKEELISALTSALLKKASSPNQLNSGDFSRIWDKLSRATIFINQYASSDYNADRMRELIIQTKALIRLEAGLFEKTVEELKNIRRCRDDYIPGILLKLAGQLNFNGTGQQSDRRLVEAFLELSQSLEEEENRLKIGSMLLSRISPPEGHSSPMYKELFLRCILFQKPKEVQYQLDILRPIGMEMTQKGDKNSVFKIIEKIESNDFEKYRYRGDINKILIKTLHYSIRQDHPKEFLKIAATAFELGKQYSIPDDIYELLIEIVKGMLNFKLINNALFYIQEIFNHCSNVGIHGVRVRKLRDITAIVNQRGNYDLKFKLYRMTLDTAKNLQIDPDDRNKSGSIAALCELAAENGDFNFAIEILPQIIDQFERSTALLNITANIVKQVDDITLLEIFFNRVQKEAIHAVKEARFSNAPFEYMIRTTLLFLKEAHTIGCPPEFLDKMLHHSINEIFWLYRLTSLEERMMPAIELCGLFARMGKQEEIKLVLNKFLLEIKRIKKPTAVAKYLLFIAAAMFECDLEKKGLRIFRRAIKTTLKVDNETDLNIIMRSSVLPPPNPETKNKLKKSVKQLMAVSKKRIFNNAYSKCSTLDLIVTCLARFNLWEDALKMITSIKGNSDDQYRLLNPLKDLIKYYSENTHIEKSLPVFDRIVKTINSEKSDSVRADLLPGLSKILSKNSDKKILTHCFHSLLASSRKLETVNYYVDTVSKYLEELRKNSLITDFDNFIAGVKWDVFDHKRKRPLYLMEFDLINVFKTPLTVARELCKNVEFTKAGSFQRTQHVLIFLIYHFKRGNLKTCKAIIDQCPQLGLDFLEFPTS